MKLKEFKEFVKYKLLKKEILNKNIVGEKWFQKIKELYSKNSKIKINKS